MMQTKELFRQGRRVFARMLEEYKEKGCQQQAAALTYMSLFALVPMMTVTFSMFSVIPAFDGVANKLQDMVFANFMPESGSEVISHLSNFSEQARSLTAVGVGFLAVTAYLMLANIERSFNAIWSIKQPRRGVFGFLLYWAILSIGPLMLGAAVLISTYVTSLKILTDIESASGGMVTPILGLLPFVMTSFLFTLLFVAVPNCPVPLRYAFYGGLATSFVMEVVKTGFSAIMAKSSFSLIYGAFAVVPLFLLWINLVWNIVLVGAIFVHVISEQKYVKEGQVITLLESVLRCLELCYTRSEAGELIRDRECIELGVGVKRWQIIRDTLLSQNIIAESSHSGSYLLRKRLSKVTLLELMHAFQIGLPDLNPLEEAESEGLWMKALRSRQEKASTAMASEFGLTLADLYASDRAAQN